MSVESESISVNTLNGFTIYFEVKCFPSILQIEGDDEFLFAVVISLDRISLKSNILPAKGNIVELSCLRENELPSIKSGTVTLFINDV